MTHLRLRDQQQHRVDEAQGESDPAQAAMLGQGEQSAVGESLAAQGIQIESGGET